MYLTFTQTEKLELSKINLPVLSVHEAQGKTFENVILVRIKGHNNMIYNKLSYAIVAISRHKNNLMYCTVIFDDFICKLLHGQISSVETDEMRIEELLSPITLSPAYPALLHLKEIKMEETEKINSMVAMYIRVKQFLFSVPKPFIVKEVYEIPSLMEHEITFSSNRILAQLLYNSLFGIKDRNLEFVQQTYPGEIPEEFSLVFSKTLRSCINPSREEYLRPVLQTLQSKLITDSLANYITSVVKRNLTVLHNRTEVDVGLVSKVLDNFMNKCIDKNKLLEIHTKLGYRTDMGLEEYLAKMDNNKFKGLSNEDLIFVKNFVYSLQLKRNAKASLKAGNTEPVASQVIAASKKITNAEFSNVAKIFTIYLKYCLDPKLVINDGLSNGDLSAIANHHLFNKKKVIPIEVDISKYDKSQDEVSLLLFIGLMARMFVPQTFLDDWYKSHTVNILKAHKLGLSFVTHWQRRSGDILTYMGNTVVLLLSLSYCYDFEELELGLFSGDDSLLLFKENAKIVDISKQLGETFNLEAKLEMFKDSMYFCSKYLIYVEYAYRFVPCPLKLFTKLGRYDMFCKEHVEEYFISFVDNVKPLRNFTVKCELNKHAITRNAKGFVHKPLDLNAIMDYLVYLSHDQHEFKRLFVGNNRVWNRPMPYQLRNKFKIQINQIDLMDEYLPQIE
jgi:hypothetical protein